MLAELVVAAAVVMVLLGTVFSLVDPARGALGVQPEIADMQQRVRSAFVRLRGDLLLAGSGPHAAAVARLRPPVMPALVGRRHAPDSGRTFASDALTILYAPPGAGLAVLAGPFPGSPADIPLAAVAGGCRQGVSGCGFSAGSLALVFDSSGRSDIVRVSRVFGAALRLEPLGPGPAEPFGAGASVVPLAVRAYRLDRAAAQLRYQNGWVTDVPVLDGVVGLTVRYFGRPALSADLRAGGTLAPCLVGTELDEAPVAQPEEELSAAALTDGPWCGGRLPFDVDLFRVRRVRLEIRVQALTAQHRGPDPLRFAAPGAARHNLAADLLGVIEVTPRTAPGY